MKYCILRIIIFCSYELALDCEVEGGNRNSTLSWWISGVRYDDSIDEVIERKNQKNKKRKIVNRLLYR